VRRAARLTWCVSVVVTIASSGPAPAAAADTATPMFSWSMADRYGGDANGDGRLDSVSSHLPRALDVHPIVVTAALRCAAIPAGMSAG
jgi:hypothetical protein